MSDNAAYAWVGFFLMVVLLFGIGSCTCLDLHKMKAKPAPTECKGCCPCK